MVGFNAIGHSSGSGFQPPPKSVGDPEAYAQQYAKEHKISLAEAKEQLRAQFGEPPSAEGTSSQQGNGLKLPQLPDPLSIFSQGNSANGSSSGDGGNDLFGGLLKLAGSALNSGGGGGSPGGGGGDFLGSLFKLGASGGGGLLG